MIDHDDPKVARLDPAGQAARREFLAWQCRIRQMSVRREGGRPTPGMRPTLSLPPDGESAGRIIVLIRKRASREVTARFQHMVRRTRDPAERLQSALAFLAEAYYQRADEFSDEMTALFTSRAPLVRRLLDADRCTLEFEQSGQRYRLECRVAELEKNDPGYQFTYWHNSLFNPAIPGDAQILSFKPNWE